MLNLDCYRCFHLVGIGGIGTSGVARILLHGGRKVSGSDLARTPLLAELEARGAEVRYGHAPGNLLPGTEVVIYSTAVAEDNPEIRESRRRRLPLLSYSQALGSLMNGRRGVAVAGTHGKTSTSAYLAYILVRAGLSPGFVIGGEVPQLGGSSAPGSGSHLVVEACEYRRNFLDLSPRAAVVTNIEEDHLDCYHGLEDIKDAFARFLSGIPAAGFALVCAENKNLMEVAARVGITRYTYGFRGADFSAEGVRPGPRGSAFRVLRSGNVLSEITIRLPGRHSILNSTAAFSAAYLLGVAPETAAAALSAFRGVKRRFEFRGKYRGADVYDDYAHHPSEITATLQAARQFFPDRRLIAVFQPHQYSRTRFFLNDFAAAFSEADMVVVPEIYFVRDSEESRRSVSGSDLVAGISARGKKAVYVASLEEALPVLKNEVTSGDVVFTIGAGPVFQLADRLVAESFRS